MRIGLEVTAAVQQGAGIGRYVRELLLALAELDKHNSYRLFYAARLPLPHALPALPANFQARRLPGPSRHADERRTSMGHPQICDY